MYRIAALLVLATAVYGLPNPENGEPALEKVSQAIGKDCNKGMFSTTCLKIGAVSLIEKLSNKEELPIFSGLSIVKEADTPNEEADVSEIARSMSFKPEEKLDKLLMYRVGTFLNTHAVKFKLLDAEAAEEAKNIIGEARAKGGGLSLGGGGKKGGGGGGLMAMALMMKGTLLSVGLGGLALLAGKALTTALLSLLLSAIIGIKSLTSGQKSTTYEIVSKPVYSHSHTHSSAHEDTGAYGHSGYGRNLNARRR